ncbi:MAG: hypothetical protein WBQ43_02285 [Terriglobales bacterium]
MRNSLEEEAAAITAEVARLEQAAARVAQHKRLARILGLRRRTINLHYDRSSSQPFCFDSNRSSFD